jgi:hypothetical protein
VNVKRHDPASAGDRAHAAAMAVVGLSIVAYWVEFFSSGKVRTSEDQAYVDFERAFPLADAYMAAGFLAAAELLRRRRPAAVPVGIAAGSAMVFLGAMDTLYNLQHGKYRSMTPEMAVEALINVVSFTFGPFTMHRLWKARGRLEGSITP